MRNVILMIFISIFCFFQAGYAANHLDKNMQVLLNQHFQKYKDLEYFSGMALSVYVPHKPIKSYFAGKMSHDRDSEPVTAETLFQIGSITKSFTAAMTLQLEKEASLKLSDKLPRWLPDYSKWSNVTIETLLNMTSGLPNYSDTPQWNMAVFEKPQQYWQQQDLISFVYPTEVFNPPLKTGYFYTNTGYILMAMIIEKITSHAFKQEIENRTIKPAELTHTYYLMPELDEKAEANMARGYNYNQYDDPKLVGRDISNVNLSWAGAAGAVISNSEDIIKWTKALFIEDKILDKAQKKKLMSLVSTTNGQKIKTTSVKHPRGFGLGVSEAYMPEIGRYWFYEGETLGFRALFMYVPCNGAIISSTFNSATNSENDHAGELMLGAYKALIKDKQVAVCK